MALPAFFATAVSNWTAYYDGHQAVSVGIKYLHIASTMVGGGAAIALDRQMFSAIRESGDARAQALKQLHGAHRTVVPALVVATISGALMMAADLDTFLASSVFWVKIAFFAALLANGVILQMAEVAAKRDEPAAWRRLKIASIASLALWLITTLIGTMLTVAA